MATISKINWKLCLFCQKNMDNENVRRPFQIERFHDSYDGIESDLKNFTAKGIEIPFKLDLNAIDNGSGIAKTLLQSQACFHHNCRVKIRPRLFGREPKMRENNAAENPPFKRIKRSDNTIANDRSALICISCGKSSEKENLVKAISFNVGTNYAQWAIDSQNWALHSRLNAVCNPCDTIAGNIHYHKHCYLALKFEAKKCRTQAEAKTTSETTYDPVAMKEVVAYIKEIWETYENHCKECK